jgi:hypothetical protein
MCNSAIQRSTDEDYTVRSLLATACGAHIFELAQQLTTTTCVTRTATTLRNNDCITAGDRVRGQ